MLTTDLRGFDKAGELLYLADSRGRDTSALVEVNWRPAERARWRTTRADAADVVRHPTEKHVQAVSFIYERKQWQVLDPAIEPDLAYLRTVVGRRRGDRQPDPGRHVPWVVLFVVDAGPARYYLYDRSRRAGSSSSPTARRWKAARWSGCTRRSIPSRERARVSVRLLFPACGQRRRRRWDPRSPPSVGVDAPWRTVGARFAGAIIRTINGWQTAVM